MSRHDVLAAVGTAISGARRAGHVRFVGVDGVDGAGKTVFADALGDALREDGHPVVRVSVDGFHRPRVERYRRGARSPEGFFLDSYDYDAFRREVLRPLAPGGERRYRAAIRDVASDEVVDEPQRVAPADAVLVVDGIFLHRDELAGVWDVSVFLDVPFAETFARMAVRDGCPADPGDEANRRYVEGQRIYLARCEPASRATFVVDNTDPARPTVRTRRALVTRTR